MKHLLVIAALLLTLSCTKTPSPAPAPTSTSIGTATSTSTSTATSTAVNCVVVTETLQLANQKVTLPRSGHFVLESHIVTVQDASGYPLTQSTNILDHIARSCALLQKYGVRPSCSDVYTSLDQKVWTPAEGGNIGQGSVGDLRPTVEQEMWSFNMDWTSSTKPAPGTKYLFTYNGKSVVANAGFETGPASSSFLGGVQGEIFWALGGADSDSSITLGRLVDQSAPLGIVSCK